MKLNMNFLKHLLSLLAIWAVMIVLVMIVADISWKTAITMTVLFYAVHEMMHLKEVVVANFRKEEDKKNKQESKG